jgi:hypothetical protein
VGFHCTSGTRQRTFEATITNPDLVTNHTIQLYARRLLVVLELIGGTCHLLFFLVTVIVLGVLAPQNTNEFVWTSGSSGLSGWNAEGVTFCLGLLSPAFAVAGMPRFYVHRLVNTNSGDRLRRRPTYEYRSNTECL